MKLITLMENTSCREDLCFEHGLSLYLETGDHKILFDAGQSGAFAENAEKLGVDLGAVDFVVLSHGHYDHSGGLGRFLECNATAPVYVSKWAFEPHWESDGRYVGVDPSLQGNSRIRYVAEKTRLEDGITLFRLAQDPMDTAGLLVEEDGVRKPDDFRHEQYLEITEENEKYLFTGCSHKGICNIAMSFNPDRLIGGFHLNKEEDFRTLCEIAQTLKNREISCITGHCTGEMQYATMLYHMKNGLSKLTTGMELWI